MKVKKSLVLVVALVCMFAGVVQAQEQQQQPSTPTTSQSSSLDIQGIKVVLARPGRRGRRQSVWPTGFEQHRAD